MPRKQTNARRRRDRAEQTGAQRREQLSRLQAEFNEALAGEPEALCVLLPKVADSDACLWDVAAAALAGEPQDQIAAEDRDMLRAMIAQTVAPKLAGRTPGATVRRHRRGDERRAEAVLRAVRGLTGLDLSEEARRGGAL